MARFKYFLNRSDNNFNDYIIRLIAIKLLNNKRLLKNEKKHYKKFINELLTIINEDEQITELFRMHTILSV